MNKQSHVVVMILLISFSFILSEKKFRKNNTQNSLTLKNQQNNASSNPTIEPNFESLCKEITLKSGIILETKCSNKSVSIDLSQCLANFYGKLVYTKNGSFDKSCNKCSIKETKTPNKNSSYVFECSCPDLGKKQYLITQINLSEFLYVKFGSLLCDDVAKLSAPAEILEPRMIDTNCEKATIISNNRFSATCTNGNSTNSANRVNVDFNLDKCISNNNGKLVPVANGSYSGSCRNCKIALKNKINFLACDCADITNAFKPVESALNKFITFRGNTIRCVEEEKNNNNNVPINVQPSSNTSVYIPTVPAVIEKLSINKNLSAADNFMILCKNLKVENVNFLKAFCGEKNLEYVLNLNNCFSNLDGTLKIAKDGSYGKSCRKCAIKFDNEEQYVLECNCQRADQKNWIDTYIALRERIVYNESRNALECLTNFVLPEDNSKKICTKD